MDSNFVKTENDNDTNNNIETEPKTIHSTSATEPRVVDEPWENATELRETSSNTTRSGRFKPSQVVYNLGVLGHFSPGIILGLGVLGHSGLKS